MKLPLLIWLLFLIELAVTDDTIACDQSTKLVEYGNIICEIDYEQCPAYKPLEITSCIGYRCKFEINGKCYYYSYQFFDTRRCLNDCCGYSLGPAASYSVDQISQCLALNIYQNMPPPDAPFNRLPIILGSVLGSIFFIILITCICCRQRIRALWSSDESNPENRPSRKNIKESNYEVESNNIQFILENSDQNIVYDKDAQCTICLSASIEMQTACGHWFHLNCLNQWLEKNLRCPNCVSEQFNPVKIVCASCHKPYVQLKLNRKNRYRSLKKLTEEVCKTCNELKS